jgi:hypothetical protein
MNKDWIQESKVLAADLRVAGFEEEPRRIMDAIESGSTGGEIYMALRWTLGEVLKENPAMEAEVKQRIDEIREGITEALGE